MTSSSWTATVVIHNVIRLMPTTSFYLGFIKLCLPWGGGEMLQYVSVTWS